MFWARRGWSSEIAFLLLALHRGRAVLVDDPALALGGARLQGLADDFGQGGRRALDRAGQRVAAERAEPHGAPLDRLAGLERQPVVVDHDELAVPPYDRALGGGVQRNDRDLFLVDVEPDVEFGPVREREHPKRLARPLARVVQPPRLRPLTLRVPAVVGVAQGKNPLLGARLLLVAPRAPDRRIEVVFFERLAQR